MILGASGLWRDIIYSKYKVALSSSILAGKAGFLRPISSLWKGITLLGFKIEDSLDWFSDCLLLKFEPGLHLIAIQYHIPTKENLFKMGVPLGPGSFSYPLCLVGSESPTHHIVTYEVVSSVWYKIFSWLGWYATSITRRYLDHFLDVLST